MQNESKELADLSRQFVAAYELAELAMNDGGNVHGTLSGLIGHKDMLVAKAVEIHEADQPTSVDTPLTFLLSTPHCMTLINGDMVATHEVKGDEIVVHTDENVFSFDVNEIVTLPTHPSGQLVTDLVTGEKEYIAFQLLRPLHPRDFRDGVIYQHPTPKVEING